MIAVSLNEISFTFLHSFYSVKNVVGVVADMTDLISSVFCLFSILKYGDIQSEISNSMYYKSIQTVHTKQVYFGSATNFNYLLKCDEIP